MIVHWFVLTILVPLVKGSLLTSQTNDSVTTELLVKRHGYPFEKHSVITDDGYILEIHRIPYSPRINSSTPHKLAFLMHGLGASSSDWIIMNSSLGYVLSDNGFDVWMGNARGNTYSNKNTKYSNKSFEFWDFSWHEISTIDLPTMINYITDLTGVQKLRYFGHSQGTTNYLVLNSMMPEWNDRFISTHLLAPVAFINNARNLLLKLGSPLVGQPNALKGVVGSFEFKPSKETVLILKQVLCNDTLPEPCKVLCDNSFFLSTEFNEDTVDYDAIPDLMATTPSSLSANQYAHYMQEYNSGSFRQYDYGLARNLVEYGSLSPPDYKLQNVKGPIFFYFGQSDKFVSRIDLDRLIAKLPSSTLAGLYVVPIPNFDHLAFLYTKDVQEKVYKAVMEDIASIN